MVKLTCKPKRGAAYASSHSTLLDEHNWMSARIGKTWEARKTDTVTLGRHWTIHTLSVEKDNASTVLTDKASVPRGSNG
jgi:hypothetical protein